VPQDPEAGATPSPVNTAKQISGMSGAPSADAMPSVHVTPIPVDAAAASGGDSAAAATGGDSESGTAASGGEAATPPVSSADDTSTAALKIVDAKSH
jgi:macrolide phosphotransferase